MQYKKIALLFGAFALLAQLSFTSSITHAEGVACNAYINPTSFDIQSTSELRVTVGNTGDTDINFIRIIPPSNAYTITANYSNEPWSGGTEEDGTMLFRDSVITPGNSMTFTMVVVTGASTSSGNAWTIESSADGGTNNTQCNGTTNTSVQGPYNISAPIISNVTISDINTTSFSLTWNTDKNATTIVNYGKTSAYSNNYSNTTLTQSHTANITGLETNTTYHFQIKSADSNNNEAQLGDNTVTTASSATIQTTTIVIKASPSPSPTPVPTPVPDTQKPEVTIFTESTKPYTTAPEIKGQATDNKGIDTIEYSVDQGKSWTGVDKIEGKGSKKAIFQFLPLQHEDGTYEIAIRALDTSQNRSDSKKIKYSIDRLPPIIGPYIATSGNQILNPLNNEITIPTKSDTTFTVPAVGGATEVKMQLGSSFIPFQQNETTHLWSTTINLQNAEKYPFAIYAKDNAGNETLRDMNTIQLVQQGRVVTEGNLPLPQAKINIFKKNALTQEFEKWDAMAYSQNNPLSMNILGEYKLLLPSGEYYLEVHQTGYQTLTTPIFTFAHTTIYNNDFILSRENAINLGLFKISTSASRNGSIINNTPNTRLIPVNFTKQELPTFSLQNNTEKIDNEFFHQRYSTITILNTWDPQASDQISQIQQASNTANSIIIFPEESEAAIRIFKQRGNYTVKMFADPDGTILAPLSIHSTPTTYFIKQDGTINNIKTGLVTTEDIVNNGK